MIKNICGLEIITEKSQNMISELLERNSPEVRNLAILATRKSELIDSIVKSAFSTNRKLILITDKDRFNQTLMKDIHMLIVLGDARDTVSLNFKTNSFNQTFH